MRDPSPIAYADSDGTSIAYRAFGEGPFDVVLVPGFVSHLEVLSELPSAAAFFDRLASFARVIQFDKRGQGLSDRPADPPTLEQSMQDLAAVMRAAGSERASVFGVSEGGPTSVLFAATHPQRVRSLVLYGTWPRMIAAPDFPGVPSADYERFVRHMAERWGHAVGASLWAPSLSGDAEYRAWWTRLLRSGTSPSGVVALMRLYADIDVRDVLPQIGVPTLVLHRVGDVVVPIEWARIMAGLIPGARMAELPGDDHLPFSGGPELLDEVEEFLTGTRAAHEPDRALATVLFTDVVDSTRRAAELGDRAWRELIERHDAAVRRELVRHRGREVKTMGDGFLATFDGPARAIRCACAAREAVRALGIEIRAGLHTGECELMGNDVGGIAVNTGARVGAAARAGEVLVSRTVTDLVAGSGIAFESRGVHVLKGVPGEWELFAVAG